MKTTVYGIVAATLLQIAAAHPHGHDVQLQEKRAIHTQVEWVDEEVLVDENNMPFTTSYQHSAATPVVQHVSPVDHPARISATPSPAPAIPPKDDSIPSYVKHPKPIPGPAPDPAPAPVSEVQLPVEAAERYAPVAAGLARSNGYGISWTPFNGEEDAVLCKPQNQANQEFDKIGAAKLVVVRLYGVACNQVALAMNAAASVNAASPGKIRLMGGIFDIANVVGETNEFLQQVQSTGLGLDLFTAISIGNEDVQKGSASVDTVIAAVNTARGILRGAGYQGPIVHVDTHGAILANPQLCTEAAGDFIAANIHPFFNPLTPAHSAGKYVKSQVDALRECSASHSRKRSEHRVVVTETGWPSDGLPHGLAIPGRVHQFAAIKSIKAHLDNDVYLFSAFDNRWQRDNAGTFGAEKHWGLLMG